MSLDRKNQTGTLPIVRKMVERLGAMIEEIQERGAHRVVLEIAPRNNVAVAEILFDEMGARLATITAVDLWDCVEINYHFCFDAEHCVVTVKTRAGKPQPQIHSITSVTSGADWIEREINDIIGCHFENHPRPERLILADDWQEGRHPLSRENQSWATEP